MICLNYNQLLITIGRPRLITVDPIEKINLTVASFTDIECIRNFNKMKLDIIDLIIQMKIPEFLHIENGNHHSSFKIKGEHCFLYFLL